MGLTGRSTVDAPSTIISGPFTDYHSTRDSPNRSESSDSCNSSNSDSDDDLDEGPEERLTSTSYLDSDGPPLDPVAYYSHQRYLHDEVGSICRVTHIFKPAQPNGRRIIVPAEWDYAAPVLGCVVEALEMRIREDFCRESFNVLVERQERPGVISVQRISMSDVEELKNHAGGKVARGGGLARQMAAKIGISGFTPDDSLLFDETLMLAYMLTLGLLSYTASHFSELEALNLGTEVDAVDFLRQDEGAIMTFECRNLACLGAFIRSPVWVFRERTAVIEEPASLSATLADIADLWGPVWSVPADATADLMVEHVAIGSSRPEPPSQGNSHTAANLGEENDMLQSAHTQRGLIYRVKPATIKSRPASGEVTCHWTPLSVEMGTSDSSNIVGSFDDRKRRFKVSQSDRLPLTFLHFCESSRLLIGASVHFADAPSMELPVEVRHNTQSNGRPRKKRNKAKQQSPAGGLRINQACLFDLRMFVRRAAPCLRFREAKRDSYLPERYQLSFSGSKYINLGASKPTNVNQVQPGSSSFWNTLRNHTRKSFHILEPT